MDNKADNIMDNIEVNEESPDFGPLVIGLLIGLIVVIIFYLYSWTQGKSKGGKSIIMMGSSEAGKTNILYSLIFEDEENNDVKTVTSMVENIENYTTSNKREVRIVDIPGYDRLRQNAFNKHKHDAMAVVFVVDSTTVLGSVRDVAEILYSILSDSVVQHKACPLLILCNKEDSDMAKDAAIIRTALEGEIDVLRETSGTRLASLEGEEKTSGAVIGRPGVAFSLDHAHNPVTFLSSSCVADGGLDALENWMDEL